jgi:hypothetical protein
MATEEEIESPGQHGFHGSAASGRIVYRAMREDSNGAPMVGPSARMLGVRPSIDIPVIAGQMQPNTGGMSVALDRPENLHPLRRPPTYGGTGKDPIWRLDVASLGKDLQFRPDSPTHGLVEPARSMTIDEFQRALEATKPFWKKLP